MTASADPLIELPAGDFKGTMEVIIESIEKYKYQTDRRFFTYKSDECSLPEFCQWLWSWLRSNVTYSPDAPLTEQIRSPSRTLADAKTGVDCEDFAIFISTVLVNNSISHSLRVADYGNGWQHIYVVVRDRKKTITIDPVNTLFNVEPVFVKKKDYRIVRANGLSGVPVNSQDENHHPAMWRNEARMKYLTKHPPVSFKTLSSATGEQAEYFTKVAKLSMTEKTPYCVYHDKNGSYNHFVYDKQEWPKLNPLVMFLVSANADMVYVSSMAPLEPLDNNVRKPEKDPAGSLKRSPDKVPNGKERKSADFGTNQDIESLLDSKSAFTESELKYMMNYSGSGGKGKQGATGEGVLYEFFTPEWVAALMWEIALAHGFMGGNVLEPACGPGVFLDTAPANAKLTGFEINPYSAKIAQLRNPSANIFRQYFETAFLDAPRYTAKSKNGTWLKSAPFDLVIGNPPYGIYQNQFSPYFPELKKKGIRQIEAAFMYWGLQLLKPKGLLVYITSSNFMRSGITYQQTKDSLGLIADLIDAYQLPGVFSASQVPTDILVFRKK